MLATARKQNHSSWFHSILIRPITPSFSRKFRKHVNAQVLNTDAEGRLTLADALVYAEKNCKAEAIIDVATLTGACMVALGTGMCAMFSPNQQLISQIKKAGSKAGELLLSFGAKSMMMSIVMIIIINKKIMNIMVYVTLVITVLP